MKICSIKLSAVSKTVLFSLVLTFIQLLTPSNQAYGAGVGSISFVRTGAGNAPTNNQYLSIPASANYKFDGDFTIEAWVKFNTLDSFQAFLGQYVSGGWSLQMVNNKVRFSGTLGGQYKELDSNKVFVTGTWYHIAFERYGTDANNIKIYVDGVLTSNADLGAPRSGALGNSTQINTVGSGTASGNDRFNGNITNVRYVNGTAVYKGAFTPTLEPLTAVTGTVLLLSTNNANFTIDSSPIAATITAYNGASTTDGLPVASASSPFPKATPTFSWANQTKAVGDANFRLTTPTPSTPGTFTYSSANTGVISLDATYTDSATVGVSGSSVITATFTPTDSASYTSGTTTMILTVNKQAQAAVVLSLSSSSNRGLGSKAITFSTTGGTDTGTVSYSVKSGGTATGCALSKANTSTSDTITATSTGTCLLQAVKAATNDYATETSTAVTFNFLSAQTFAYDSGTATSGTIPTGGTYYAGDTITVSSGSGLSKPGFKLNGWKNNSNVSYATGSTFTISTSDTLTAQWRQASLFGIADADLTEVQNWNVISGFSAGGNIGNGTDTFTVTVPANSLPAGTAVKLYALSSTALAQSKIGAGNTYILNMVVAWLYGQTVPTASSAVTLKIESPSIKKDAVAYMIIGDTVTAVGTATQDGVINTYFTEDPVITVVNPVVQNNNGGGGGGNAVVTVEKPVEVVAPVEINKPGSSKMISMSTKVYFGLNASWINSLNIKSVKEFIAKVSSSASIKEVTIQGFTQPTKINPNPLGLSKARANSVAKLVRGLGITNKVVAVGKGNEKKNLPSSRYVLVTVTGEAKS
jgi:outer membrane protein OmpA-like peptidoglycan-associated protein